MKNKDRYYKALIENNGHFNEIDLGEKIGFDENTTREIIVQLMSEHKIDHIQNRVCSYSITKTVTRKIKKKY